MKIKIIIAQAWSELEKEVNHFLIDNPDVKDIKYSETRNEDSCRAFILYNEK